MKKYIVVHDTGIISMENEVNRKMEEGYKPYGSMQISYNGDRNTTVTIFCQPMRISKKKFNIMMDSFNKNNE